MRKPNRKASKPLYVMLTEDEKVRYATLAGALGMSMRDTVKTAFELLIATAYPQEIPDPNGMLTRALIDLGVRMTALENRLSTNECRHHAIRPTDRGTDGTG